MSPSVTPKQALFLWHLILTEGASEAGVKASETVPRLTPAEWQALVKDGYLDSTKPGRAILLTATNKAWSWAELAERVELAKLDSAAGAAALEALLNRLLPLLRERGIGLADLFKNDPSPVRAHPTALRVPRKKSATKAAPKKKPMAKKAPGKKEAKTKKSKTKKPKPKTKKPSTKPPKSKKTSANAKPSKENPQSAKRSSRESFTSAPPLSERIEQSCLMLAHGARQTRVALRDLRAHLADVARDDLDGALLALQRDKKLVLYREDNTAALRPEDHRAALLVGNEPRHLVLLEA